MVSQAVAHITLFFYLCKSLFSNTHIRPVQCPSALQKPRLPLHMQTWQTGTPAPRRCSVKNSDRRHVSRQGVEISIRTGRSIVRERIHFARTAFAEGERRRKVSRCNKGPMQVPRQMTATRCEHSLPLSLRTFQKPRAHVGCRGSAGAGVQQRGRFRRPCLDRRRGWVSETRTRGGKKENAVVQGYAPICRGTTFARAPRFAMAG